MAEPRPFKVLELSPEERQAFLDRIRPGHVITEDDCRIIHGIVRGFSEVVAFIEKKDTTLRRLRDALFGGQTEKTAVVCLGAPTDDGAPAPPELPKSKPKRKGHGRLAARRYGGARTVPVTHPHLHAGDVCSECQKGRLHPLQPSPILRLVGQAPVAATRFELQRLRCAICGVVFTAPAPPEAGTVQVRRFGRRGRGPDAFRQRLADVPPGTTPSQPGSSIPRLRPVGTCGRTGEGRPTRHGMPDPPCGPT